MRKILLILLIVFYSSSFSYALTSANSVKAAFIFHFINFTEWSDQKSEYDVCIPEDEELRADVDRALKGKVVNNRRIAVVDRYDDCHILVSRYAPSSDETLTIGSLDNGALMEFRTIDHKLKFAVNPLRIQRSKLKISSQLLKLAILD